MPTEERRTVRFIGHVQGVGFRYTVLDLAKRYHVNGFVRNLADGGVEMIAEGDPGELDVFIAAIGSRMEQFIREIRTSTQPATAEFSNFSIRP